MKNLLLLLLFLLSASITAFSQAALQRLDVNKVSALILDGGDMDWDPFYSNPIHGQYNVPKDTTKPLATIFASALWIGGYEGTNLHLAAMTYRQNGKDFFPGPVGKKYAPDTAIITNKWDRVWRVYKSEIDSFKNGLYSTIPADILNWPANGDISNGESRYLAPFENISKSGKYDPSKGDYPLIRGDEALYSIINDTAHRHTESGGKAFGIEVHVMPYSYNDTTAHLDYTTFYHYVIFNRSKINYTKVLVGIWINFNIGAPNDDMVGCDTNLNAFYAYNGEDKDTFGIVANPFTLRQDTIWGYGKNPPAQAAVFLNQHMTGFINYQNDFSVQGNPQGGDAPFYYNYLNSKWTNGAPIVGCGIGYPGGACTDTTRYLFPGDPATGIGWSWKQSHIRFDDTHAIGSLGPFNLDSGQYICFDVAYVYARGDSGATSSVTELKKQVKRVQAFYDRQAYACDSIFNGIRPSATTLNNIRVSPNPSNGNITVSLNILYPGNIQYQIINSQGKMLSSGTHSNANSWDMDISSYPAGIYFLKCTTAEGEYVAKVVKE